MHSVELVWPSAEHLAGCIQALERGWSPDTLRPEAAVETLIRISRDPARFVAEQIDREAKGPLIILHDGREVPRLPSYTKWMWDGDFCGTISFRWQPGTTELPPYCLGHIGYSVVPWKRRRGYATRALQLFLPEVRNEGLPFVEITTDADNLPSQRVIEANGGKLIEKYPDSEEYRAGKLRFRVFFTEAD